MPPPRSSHPEVAHDWIPKEHKSRQAMSGSFLQDASRRNSREILIENTGFNSNGSSVSTYYETDAAVHPRRNFMQDTGYHSLSFQAPDIGGATCTVSISGGIVSHTDETQFSLEMRDLDQSDLPKRPPPPRSCLRLMYIWKWEIFTWTLGTIGFLANLILMVISNGMLQKEWHSRIQITAFVAALAQVSQSALLVPTASSIGQLKWEWVSLLRRPAMDIQRFDLASRGPDGSMRLLWHFALKQ